MNELPQDPKGTAERFVELYREEDKKFVKEVRKKAKKSKRKNSGFRKVIKSGCLKVKNMSLMIFKIFGVIRKFTKDNKMIMFLSRILKYTITTLALVWGFNSFLYWVNGLIGVQQTEHSATYHFVKMILILSVIGDLLPTLIDKMLGTTPKDLYLNRKGKAKGKHTMFKHPLRIFNPLYHFLSITRMWKYRKATKLGSELALTMGLWSSKDDYNTITKRKKGIEGKIEYERGPYKAMGYKDKKTKSILFEMEVVPHTLTQEGLLNKVEKIKDEYGIEFVKDCRREKEDSISFRSFGCNFAINKHSSIRMMFTNPLEESWEIKSSKELEFDEEKMAIFNAINIEGEKVPLILNSTPGVVIGGVPGSGKSAGLQTSLTRMVQTGKVDLTIIDLKGGITEWRHFNKVANVMTLDQDEETGEQNYQEIYDKLQEINREGLRRMKLMPELKGVANFWNAPITKDLPFKILVLDECQSIFDESEVSEKEEREIIRKCQSIVANMVRKFRSVGICVIMATQKPTSDTIPSKIRDNCGLRLSFRVGTQAAEMATLGPDDGIENIKATNIPDRLKGMAVTRNEDGKRQYIRYAYMNEKYYAKELEDFVKEQESKLFA